MDTIYIKSATLFEKNKKIYISFYLNNGSRIRFSTGLTYNSKNKSFVEKEKFNLAQQHYIDTLPSDAKTLFKDIAFEALRSTSGNRSEDIQKDYENLLTKSLMPAFGHLEIGKILPKHIQEWKESVIKKGLGKSRFHKYWTTLSLVITYLTINEMIDKNPQSLVSRASKNFKESNDNSSKYYSPSEVNEILRYAKGWFGVFLHTMFFTSMRTGEGLALQWKYVDFDRKKITIAHSAKNAKLKSTKTSKVRVVDMPQTLYDVLKEHYESRISDIFVFPSFKTMKPYHGSGSLIKNHLKPLLKKLGIEYKTLYATRHSGASALANANVSLAYIQKMLGHSRISTTDKYIKNSLIDVNEMSSTLDAMYQ